jgi:exodeoxyribonuclease VII small subunit
MKNEKSFEEAIGELEAIVQQLEKGELPLDESLEVFQRGIELSKFCSKRLDQIEKKITILLENKDGDITEEEFKLEV